MNDLTRDTGEGSWDNPIRDESQLADYTVLRDMGAAAISAGVDQYSAWYGVVNALERANAGGTGSFKDPITGVSQTVNVKPIVKAATAVATATQSEKLQAGIEAYNKAVKDRGGEAVFQSIARDPYTFVMSKFMPEVFSEVVPLAASLLTGGATLAASRALRAAGNAAIRKQIAGQVAYGTSVVAAAVETGGSTYDGAYDKLLRAYMEYYAQQENVTSGSGTLEDPFTTPNYGDAKNGLSSASINKAEEAAHNSAGKIALTASAIEFLSSGLDPSPAFSKNIFDKTGITLKDLSKNIPKLLIKAVPEGMSEALEESLVAQMVIDVELKLAPWKGGVGRFT